MVAPDVELVTVFADAPGGGNPAPIVLDADAMTDTEMRAIAARYGHESGFVRRPSDGETDLDLRFWVPNFEMEMCAHATLGAIWLLAQRHRLPAPAVVSIGTRSGTVDAEISASGDVRIRQPAAEVSSVPDPGGVLAALGLGRDDLAGEVINASTSRVKTLVPLRAETTLDRMSPDLAQIPSVCDAIGSTGLYPFVAVGRQEFAARQFPASSGYPEDAATGIAAAALVCAMGGSDADYEVTQGAAMGRPSRIRVHLERDGHAVIGCWISGSVSRTAEGSV